MKRFLAAVLMTFLLGCAAACAQGPDDQYVRIYNLIQEGDALLNNAQASQSLAKYLEAQTALARFQKVNPDWNPKVVAFRLNYLSGKIAAVSAKVPAASPAAPTATATTAPVPAPATATASGAKPGAAPVQAPRPPLQGDLDRQLNTLKDQVRQMQADRMVLEAKLKESLSAQPASIDPRQLAKTEEQLKSLQKQNDLLKVTLDGEKAKRAQLGGPPQSLEKTQQALAEANRKLAEQTEKANTLNLEKTALQNKLTTLIPSAWNATALETTKRALEDANRQIAEQKDLATKWGAEREALLARLKTSNPDTDAAALRAENQLLKKQLADLRSTPAKGGPADAVKQLAQAQAQIAALQSDKEILRLEKIALESRVKQLSMQGIASTVLPPVPTAEDAARIKQLERERDDLQKKLEAANKELFGRNGKAVAGRVEEMENQLATLRARLEVFESRQVPYSPEELALFKRPETRLAVADPKAGKKSIRELPAGSASLVAEAQRYFSVKQLDKAEEKYLQVLRQDEKNVPTLANLAAIQLERDEMSEAEKNIKQAVALAPDDSYSLSILGYLKFRQEKYDDALDALSRAAKLDPQNAQVQNYLGITLSHKGMRGPAETALRKSIQLEPGYGSAHHNLAIIYLTQSPPLVELGRWHYQKALASGHPRNPEVEKMLEAPKTADNRGP